MRKLTIIGILMIGTLLGACGYSKGEEANHVEMVAGDIREETNGIEELPEFLSEKPDDMKTIYEAAARHQELLESIPCYCGCGDSVGHKDNYDCFIHENGEDGRIVWDDHGTKCPVCLEIAAQTMIDYQNGKTIKEIRNDIEEKYKEGYAAPTPTKEI